MWKGVWGVGLLYPLYTWASRVSENIWHIGSLEHQLNWNMPSVKSKIDALSIVPTCTDAPNAVSLSDESEVWLSFDNVCHQYPVSKDERIKESEDSLPVLKNVSFTIHNGEKVALIGESGSGKTSIMRLALRFMDPTSGSIRIGNIDLRDIRLKSWLRRVGYIPQRDQIYDGTVKYNLIYGLPEEIQLKITDEELWELMRSLEIDFGKRLTSGLETIVGRSGVKLSGGQAQRLMIGSAVLKARYLARSGGLMVVDEATSSLDSTTEKKVHHGLKEALQGNISALVVAHRLSTVRHLCTKFIVLKSSTSIANGDSQIEAIAPSFEELVKISPIFCQLARDQEISI